MEYSVTIPPEPTATKLWDRNGHEWNRSSVLHEWVESYGGSYLKWDELVCEYGPLTDTEMEQ